MEFQTFNKAINYLLVYLVVLFLLIGVFGNDLVGDMVNFVFLYGIPLLIFIILYMVTIAYEVHNKINKKTEVNIKQLGVTSIKLCLAIAPMFYLDNSFASLLSTLRLE